MPDDNREKENSSEPISCTAAERLALSELFKFFFSLCFSLSPFRCVLNFLLNDASARTLEVPLRCRPAVDGVDGAALPYVSHPEYVHRNEDAPDPAPHTDTRGRSNALIHDRHVLPHACMPHTTTLDFIETEGPGARG